MKAFAIYEKLDDIPEVLRAQATEVDGKFQLPVEGLTNKVTELLGTNTKYKTIYDKFKDLGDNIDSKKVQQALTEMQDADKREEEVNKRILAAVADNNKARQKDIDDALAREKKIRGSLEERIIDGDLGAAVTAAEGDPFFVIPSLRQNVRTFEEGGKYVAKVVDADGKPRLNAATGAPMTLADLVTEAKADKKFASVFKAPAASGAGAAAAAASRGAQGQAGSITITREQATNNREYRAAMEKVGGDASKIQIAG